MTDQLFRRDMLMLITIILLFAVAMIAIGMLVTVSNTARYKQFIVTCVEHGFTQEQCKLLGKL